MRFVLILLGAAVVAYVIGRGVAAILKDRNERNDRKQITNDKE